MQEFLGRDLVKLPKDSCRIGRWTLRVISDLEYLDDLYCNASQSYACRSDRADRWGDGVAPMDVGATSLIKK